MSISLNGSIGSLYLGSTKIGEAYLGSTLVFPSATPPEPTNPYYVDVFFTFSPGNNIAIGNFTLDGTAIDMRLIDTSTPVSLNGSFANINGTRAAIPADVLGSIEGTGLVYKANMTQLCVILKLDGDNKPDSLGFTYKFKNASYLSIQWRVNTLYKRQDGSYNANATIRSGSAFRQAADTEYSNSTLLHT